MENGAAGEIPLVALLKIAHFSSGGTVLPPSPLYTPLTSSHHHNHDDASANPRAAEAAAAFDFARHEQRQRQRRQVSRI